MQKALSASANWEELSLDKTKCHRWIDVGSIHNYPSQKDKPYCGLSCKGEFFKSTTLIGRVNKNNLQVPEKRVRQNKSFLYTTPKHKLLNNLAVHNGRIASEKHDL